MKIKQITSAIAGVFLIAGCNEKTIEQFTHDGERIIVRTEVGTQTKAGYEGTTSLPEKFIMDINQGADESYDYPMLEMTKESTGNIYNAPEGSELLWADNTHDNVSIKALTLPFGTSSIDPENPMTINVCQDQTTDRNINESDLLGAYSGNGIEIDGNDIKIIFKHLMSKLYVTYQFGDEFTDNIVNVKSLVLENICVTGGYSYAEMDYDENVSKDYGNIKMYHDQAEKTAEGIFYPYIPEENPVLAINTTIDGTDKTFRCPIALKSAEGFLGGKRYKMNVTIKSSSVSNVTITLVKDWETDETSIDTAESVLWVGTSIPAGDGDNNYPKMVADEIGFNLYNNARGASFVCFYSSEEDGTSSWAGASDWTEYESQVWKGYSLSATIQEIEDKFGPDGLNIPDWLIESYKDHSFERLIIPYIDGTVANCSTIIFDHGYNDRSTIINECSWHPGDGEEQFKAGSGWDWVYNLRDTRNKVSEEYFQSLWWDDVNGNHHKNHYFYAITYLIKRCLEVNPRIKIIFGNYFAWKSPVFAAEYGDDNLCNFICAANEALAGMWKRNIVNVYEYTGIRNIGGDYQTFCPDGVHPHSDTTGESNRIIAGIYVNELNGII